MELSHITSIFTIFTKTTSSVNFTYENFHTKLNEYFQDLGVSKVGHLKRMQNEIKHMRHQVQERDKLQKNKTQMLDIAISF